jgi:hypothetical protein
MMLCFLSIGLAIPIHRYDVCLYSVAIALVGAAKPVFQVAFLIPAIFVWRQDIFLNRLHLGTLHAITPENQIGPGQLVATVAWLTMLILTMMMADGNDLGSEGSGSIPQAAPHLA